MLDRLYLDSCVLNRLTDDQTQERVRSEAFAISRIMDAVATGTVELVSSSALYFELAQSSDQIRRIKTIQLLDQAKQTVIPHGQTFSRAQQLMLEGVAALDALHVALAEQARATLLTVDDRLLRRATALQLEIENPVNWLRRRKPWLIKR